MASTIIVRPLRHGWLWSCFGSVVFGITLPVMMACLASGGTPVRPCHPPEFPPFSLVVEQLFMLEFIALLFCGPGAVILASILYVFVRDKYAPHMEQKQLLAKGMVGGAMLAFANVPGYLSGAMLGWERPLTEIRVALLFISAGVVSGSWIAWQAYRMHHAEAGFFPQYSLKTLVLVMLSLGAVLAVFSPTL